MADDVEIVIKAKDQTKQGIASAKSSVESMGKSWASAFNPLEEIAKGAFRRVGEMIVNTMANIGKAIVDGITSAIGFVVDKLGSALQASMDFEKGMKGVQTAFGATGEEAVKLGTYIDQLALDPTLRVSADDAALALETLGKAGITTNEAMGGVAQGAVLLANATGEGIPLATEVAVKAMAAWGFQAQDMTTIVNQVTGATESSTLSLQDMFLAYSMGGGAAAAAGVDFEDFNAVMAASIPLFSSGSDAGTSFKTFLDRLIPTTKEATTMMRELGLFTGTTDDEFAKLSKTQLEAAGSIEQTKLQIEQQSLNLEKLNSKQIAVNVAMANGTMTTDAGTLKLRDLELQQDAVRMKLEDLNGTLEAGESAQDAMNKGVQRGTNAFFDANGQMKSASDIAELLQNALAGLSEEKRKEALSTIFGSDAQRTAIGLMNAGKEGIEKYQQVIGDTSAQERAAQMTDNTSDRFDNFRETVDVLSRKIGDAFLPAADKIIGWGKEMFDKWQPRILEVFDNIGGAVTGLVEDFTGSTPQFDEWIGGLLDGVENLVKGFKDSFPTIRDMVQKVWDQVKPIVAAMAKSFSDFAAWFASGGALDMIKWAVNFAANIQARFHVIGESISLLGDMFKNLGLAVGELVRGNFSGIDYYLSRASSMFQELDKRHDAGYVQNLIDNYVSNSGLGQFAAGLTGTTSSSTPSPSPAHPPGSTETERQVVWEDGSSSWVTWSDILSQFGGDVLAAKAAWDKSINSRIRTYAKGGMASGWSWVGEEGPELVNLPGGSRVYPAGESQRMSRSIHIENINLQGGADAGQSILNAVQLMSALYG